MDINLIFSRVINRKELEYEIIKYINNGGDINICDRYGDPLLMKACYNRFSIDTIKLILSKNIDINKQNDDGETALMHAVTYYDFEGVKLLLDFGADMDIKSKRSNTALFGAFLYKENMKQMLEYKYTRKQCCYYHVHTFYTWKDKYNMSYYHTILERRCSSIDYYGYFYTIFTGVL